jgi:hypothetical protein
VRGKGENDKLGAMDKILASSIGGALATWNQPIEVVRVEVSLITCLLTIQVSLKTSARDRCNRWLRPLQMLTARQNLLFLIPSASSTRRTVSRVSTEVSHPG